MASLSQVDLWMPVMSRTVLHAWLAVAPAAWARANQTIGVLCPIPLGRQRFH